MSKTIEANQSFKGKDGELWWGTEQFGTVESFEMKVTPDYEEYKLGGRTWQEQQGYSLSGTMSRIKIDNNILKKLAPYIKANQTFRFMLIGKESSGTKETRIMFTDCTADELTLIAFSQGESRKEEIPLKASDFEILNAD